MKRIKSLLALVSIALLLCTSCRSAHDRELEKQLIGEWKIAHFGIFDHRKGFKIVTTDSLPDSLYNYSIYSMGFEFCQNGICFNKCGYSFRFNDRQSCLFETKFRIDDDSLKIWNPTDHIWEKYAVLFKGKDSLFLTQKNHVYLQFARWHYPKFASDEFEQIIYNNYTGWGCEPIYITSIDKEGNVLCCGRKNQREDAIYSSKINPIQFIHFLKDFQKAGIHQLRTQYGGECFDCSETSITFIKNHRIYKTIFDKGNAAPKEFIWAYDPLRYYYQQLPLKKEEFKRIGFYNFKDLNHNVIDIRPSESFYLETELMHAKPVQKKIFKYKYTLPYYKLVKNDFIKQLAYSDGRYYQYQINEQTITLDLGYNFIERNGLEKRMEKEKNWKVVTLGKNQSTTQAK